MSTYKMLLFDVGHMEVLLMMAVHLAEKAVS